MPDIETLPAPTEAAPTPESTPTPSPETTQAAAPFDPANLPPELQGTYKSMQDDFAKREADYQSKLAQASQANDPDYIAWKAGYVKPAASAPAAEKAPLDEYSDEQLAAIGISRQQAMFLDQLAEKRARAIAEPQVNQLRGEQTRMTRTMEISEVGKAYPDFWELDKRGLIEPVMAKYKNISAYDAYRLAKYDDLRKEAVDKAHNIVAGKRAASVERPGVPSASVKGPIKVKNRQEAAMVALDYQERGLQIPEIEVVKA